MFPSFLILRVSFGSVLEVSVHAWLFSLHLGLWRGQTSWWEKLLCLVEAGKQSGGGGEISLAIPSCLRNLGSLGYLPRLPPPPSQGRGPSALFLETFEF